MTFLKKIKLTIIGIFFLNGCVQSTALFGPAITIGTTGNIMHAGIQYGTTRAIKKETGKDPLSFIRQEIEKSKKKRKEKKDLKILVEKHIKKSSALIREGNY